MLALCEMCFEGLGAVAKGGSVCWHWSEWNLLARGQLKRGFEMLALGEMCFAGMGAVEKGVSDFGTG